MISRQKLLRIKKVLKGDHHEITNPYEVIHSLVDHGLECLDRIDGGAEQRDWAAERAVADKQVRLALDDLRKEIDHPSKAFYIADCIDQMLRAKTAWAREWAHYQPKIEEEFG